MAGAQWAESICKLDSEELSDVGPPFFANPLESRDIGTDGSKKIGKYEENAKKAPNVQGTGTEDLYFSCFPVAALVRGRHFFPSKG